MRLLLCLAERAGQTISNDELMDHVWPGTIVTQDSIYQAVASLRRLLGDDPKRPAYIATVPRRGYRLVAKVLAAADNAQTYERESGDVLQIQDEIAADVARSLGELRALQPAAVATQAADSPSR